MAWKNYQLKPTPTQPSPLVHENQLETEEQNFSPNSLYIFILSVNFENLTAELYVLIISFMLVKFQEVQRSIAMFSNKY